MREVLITVTCDVCQNTDLTEDDVYSIEYTISGVNYEQDRCIDCAGNLIAQSRRITGMRKLVQDAAPRPFLCDYTDDNGPCSFAGKTERGLSNHQTRAGHRSD